jgi:hypothetical protein
MSDAGAVWTFNDLRRKLKDLPVQVLLGCDKGGGTPGTNLTDIASGRGHILVTTPGRMKTLEDTPVYPEADALLLEALRLRRDEPTQQSAIVKLVDDVRKVDLFGTVKSMVIVDHTFFSANSADGHAGNLDGISVLTRLFNKRWTVQLIRIIDLYPLEAWLGNSSRQGSVVSPFSGGGYPSPYPRDQNAMLIGEKGDWYKLVGDCKYTASGPVLPSVKDTAATLPILRLIKIGRGGMDEDPSAYDRPGRDPNMDDMGSVARDNIDTSKKTVVIVEDQEGADDVDRGLNWRGSDWLTEAGATMVYITSDRSKRARDRNQASLASFNDPGSSCKVMIVTADLASKMRYQADRVIIADLPSTDIREDDVEDEYEVPYESRLADCSAKLILLVHRIHCIGNGCDAVVLFHEHFDRGIARVFRGYLGAVGLPHRADPYNHVEFLNKAFPGPLTEEHWG